MAHLKLPEWLKAVRNDRTQLQFNPYDEAILALLRNAAPDLESVLVIDKAPNIARAQSLWPNAEISGSPPPPEGATRIRDWLNPKKTATKASQP